MYHWEMAVSHLHKGNCGYSYINTTIFCNGTGMEYTESEGMDAIGKCLHYAFKVIVKHYDFIVMGTGCGIHRYDQRQEEKECALALGLI